jgi:hypothetical protein
MSKNNASSATIKKKTKKRQNENTSEQTETEVIGVMIPYVTPPSDTTEATVLQIDDTQENFQDNASSSFDYASSDKEAKTEIVIDTSEKKNSWVWSFYSQV